MEGCCNSEATQESYKEIFDKIVGFCNDVIQSYMDMEVDWTEAILGTLFVAHITILILFFCSRSLIAATFREWLEHHEDVILQVLDTQLFFLYKISQE